MSCEEKKRLELFQPFKFSAKEKVFFNPEMMTHLLSYMDFGSILSCLEAQVGCMEDLLSSESVKRKMLQQLLNFLVQNGWDKNMRPVYGSFLYVIAEDEIASYMKIIRYIKMDKDDDLGILVDKLVKTFNRPSEKKVKVFNSTSEKDRLDICQGEYWTRILIRLGGAVRYLSATAFILSQIAEYAQKKSDFKNGSKEKKAQEYDNSYIVGGCIDGALLHGLASKIKGGQIVYKKLEIEGIHIDSSEALVNLKILASNFEKIGRGHHINHLIVSAEIGMAGWEALYQIMNSNPKITWGYLESTHKILRKADHEVVMEIWEMLGNCIQLMPGEQPERGTSVGFSRGLGDWSLENLLNCLDGESIDYKTDYRSLIEFLN